MVLNEDSAEHANEYKVSTPSRFMHIAFYIFFTCFFHSQIDALKGFACFETKSLFINVKAAAPWIHCVKDSNGPFFWASVSFSLIYLVGFPLSVILLLWWNKNYILVDSPKLWWMRFLYFDYKPAYYYYEFILLLRKVVLGFSIIFVENIAFYLQLGTLVISIICDVVLRPFSDIKSLILHVSVYTTLLLMIVFNFSPLKQFSEDIRLIVTLLFVLTPFALLLIIAFFYDFLWLSCQKLVQKNQKDDDDSLKNRRPFLATRKKKQESDNNSSWSELSEI